MRSNEVFVFLAPLQDIARYGDASVRNRQVRRRSLFFSCLWVYKIIMISKLFARMRVVRFCCINNFQSRMEAAEDEFCTCEDRRHKQDENLESSVEVEVESRCMEKISEYFQENIRGNDAKILVAEHASAELLSCFRGNRPGFDVQYYIKRISKYSGVSSSCFVVARIYLERLQIRFPCFALTSRTLQRLLLVAVMIATKYLEDCFCLNTRW